MTEIQRLSDRVFAFVSRNYGSNAYLIKGDTHTALIDSSLPINSPKIHSLLSTAHVTAKDIAFVLHTHGHADHWGNSVEFNPTALFMHEHDARYVNAQDTLFTYADLFDLHAPINIPHSNHFQKNQFINLGHVPLQVLFTPGHTQGSVSFYEPEQKLLFSGDTLFHSTVGRTDLHSSNFEELSQSLHFLYQLPIETLLPGHGKFVQGLENNTKNFKGIFSRFNIRRNY